MGDAPEFLEAINLRRDSENSKDQVILGQNIDPNMISLELERSGVSPGQSKSKLSRIEKVEGQEVSYDSLDEMPEIKYLY